MAQFFTDFEEYTAGVDLTTQDWTQRWDDLGSSFDTIDSLGDIIGSFQAVLGSGLDELISWDDAGTPQDVEVAFETEIVGTEAQLIAVVRGAGASASAADGYGITLHVANNALRVQQVLNGAVTFELFQQPLGVTLADGQRWIVRFRVNGTSVMAKAWQAADPEPGTWLIDGTNSSISAGGWVGLNSFEFNNPFPVHKLGVGTNGDAAPLAAPGPSVTAVWATLGAVTEGGATVVCQTTAAASLSVEVDTDPAFPAPDTFGPITTASASNFVGKVTITAGGDNVRYYWRPVVDGVASTIEGTFLSRPPQGGAFKIAFSSCVDSGVGSATFDRIAARAAAEDIHMFLHMGDDGYLNNTVADIEIYRTEYETNLALPGRQALHESVAWQKMWSDHDYGDDGSDGTLASRTEARLSYREHVPHYSTVAGTGDNAVYQSFKYGGVRFILTDLRSERDPNSQLDDANKSMMGVAQKTWFKQQCLTAKTQGDTICWLSTVPWSGVATAGEDHWAGFSTERNELADFFRDNDLVSRLFIASADQHCIAADDGTNSDFATAGGAPLNIVSASPIDKAANDVKGGPYSEGTVQTLMQYAVIEFGAESNGQRAVTFRGYDDTDTAALIHSFALSIPTSKPLKAFTWDPFPASTVNLRELIWSTPTDLAADIAADTIARADGERAVFVWTDWLRDPHLVGNIDDLLPGGFDSPWLDNGTADVKARWETWVDDFAAAGGDIDILVIDYEREVSSFTLEGQAHLDAIIADPRSADLEAAMSPHQLEDVLTNNDAARAFNHEAFSMRSQALEAAIFQPVWDHFPAVEGSNYGDTGITLAELPDLTWRFPQHKPLTGTHKNHNVYGRDGQGEFAPYESVQVDIQRVRSMVRSSPDPMSVWVAYDSFTDAPIAQTPYYKEIVIHAALHNPERVLFFNPDPSVPDADETLFDDILTEINTQIGTEPRTVVTDEPVVFTDDLLVSAMRTGTNVQWRVTTRVEGQPVEVYINDAPQGVLTPAPGEAGVWYTSEQGQVITFQQGTGETTAHNETILLTSPDSYYRYGELSGTAAVDETGVQPDGTYVNGVDLGLEGITADDAAPSLNTNTTDYIRLPRTFDPSSGSWSLLLCYFMYPGNPAFPVMYAQEDGLGIGREWLRYDEAGANLQTTLGGTAVTLASNVQKDRWHRTFLVYDGADLLCYQNGVLTNTIAGIAIESATGDHLLGTGKDLTADYGGRLDENPFWSRQLLASEVTEIDADIIEEEPEPEPAATHREAILNTNPFSYYRYGELSGTAAVDETGVQPDGTYVNGVGLGAAGITPLDAAASLSSATNDYIELPTLIDPSAAPWTLLLCAFIDPGQPTPSVLYSQEDGGGIGRNWLQFEEATNQLQTTLGGATNTFAGGITPDTWYRIFLRYNGSDLECWVNGALTTTIGAIGIESATGNHLLGTSKTLSGMFGGREDENGFWTRQITTTELLDIDAAIVADAEEDALVVTPQPMTVVTRMGLARARLAGSDTFRDVILNDSPFWYADGSDLDNTDTVVTDDTGNGRHGTIVGTVTPNVPVDFGSLERAFRFEATDISSPGGHIELPFGVGGTTEGTFEAWVNIDGFNGHATVFADITAGNDGHTLTIENFEPDVNGDDFVLWQPIIHPASVQLASPNFSILPGEWYHIVATWSASGYELWLNRSLVATDPGSGGVQVGAGTLCIGDIIQGYTHPMDGLIAHPVYYDYALSETAIKTHFDRGLELQPSAQAQSMTVQPAMAPARVNLQEGALADTMVVRTVMAPASAAVVNPSAFVPYNVAITVEPVNEAPVPPAPEVEINPQVSITVTPKLSQIDT